MMTFQLLISQTSDHLFIYYLTKNNLRFNHLLIYRLKRKITICYGTVKTISPTEVRGQSDTNLQDPDQMGCTVQ